MNEKNLETQRGRAATKKEASHHGGTEARRKARNNSQKIKVKTSTQRTQRKFEGGEL
jgi:hypothetical protein